MDERQFEICDVIAEVVELARDNGRWTELRTAELEDMPKPGQRVSVRLEDGSVLNDALYTRGPQWSWRGLDVTSDVVAFADYEPETAVEG